MSADGRSGARLGRMRDVMIGHVERGAVPGLVTRISRRSAGMAAWAPRGARIPGRTWSAS